MSLLLSHTHLKYPYSCSSFFNINSDAIIFGKTNFYKHNGSIFFTVIFSQKCNTSRAPVQESVFLDSTSSPDTNLAHNPE